MLPTTPTAEISRSAVIVCVAPLPSSMVAVTQLAAFSTFVTLAPVRILMPCFSKRLRAKRRDLGVLDRQDLRQHLDHRHLGAHGAVERGELDADRARAHDDQRFRHRRRAPSPRNRSRSACRPARCPGRTRGPRAGGDDDVLGGVGALAQRALRRGVRGCIAGLVGLPTMTSPGLVMPASPQMTSTLFFFIRKPTPPLSCAETPRERLTTAAMSKPACPAIVSP